MTDSSLWPIALYFISVLVLVIGILIVSALLGEKSEMSRATGEPFESGVVHIGSAQIPAMFFVIFDLETVFIFAWAVAFHELSVFGFLAISVFIFILVIALIYEWKSGALDWGVKVRKDLPSGYTLQKLEE